MINNLKALVAILAIAWIVYWICGPICLNFMSPEAFRRRRNAWFTLTVVAFISPSFWIYAIFAAIFLSWTASRDDNPLALFAALLFTIPNVSFYIPTVLINQLFDLTQYRILTFVIVIPWIIRSNSESHGMDSGFRREYLFLAAFLLLQIAEAMPYESLTTSMRRSFLLGLDIFVLVYAFARLQNRAAISEVMASFWTALFLMAPMAIFESLKGWLLYTGISELWGDPNLFSWLFRGEALRAQAAAGHSINLGFHLAVALGLYLFVRTRGVGKLRDFTVLATLIGGILVTYSRGAWVTAALVAALFVVLRPEAARRAGGALAVGMLIFGVMYVSPLKESVIDRLPFIGTADQDTIEYRRILAEISWSLIQQNPFFGDPFAASRMDSLRQGQGLIDIVNGYIFTALFNGLVGLGLLVSFSWLSLLRNWSAYRLARRERDIDTAMMGASILACVIGSLFYVSTAGYGPTVYILCALAVAYGCSAPTMLAKPIPLVHRSNFRAT